MITSYSSSTPGLFPAKRANIPRRRATREKTTGSTRNICEDVTILLQQKMQNMLMNESVVVRKEEGSKNFEQSLRAITWRRTGLYLIEGPVQPQRQLVPFPGDQCGHRTQSHPDVCAITCLHNNSNARYQRRTQLR